MLRNFKPDHWLKLAFALFTFSFTTFAQAGDFASRQILGFSEDGSLFAFEEYGVQDGSGFPYSNIYLINTDSDTWIAGSPYRVLLEDETKSIFEARNRAHSLAKEKLSMITRQGVINATNQPLEITPNPKHMIARPWHFVPPTSERIEFKIEQYPLPSKDYCKDYGGAKGFRLVQLFQQENHPPQLLHEDIKIPNSRNCPSDYRFADIVTYRPLDNAPMIAAILVLYEGIGFEGPDGRYLAITTKLAKPL